MQNKGAIRLFAILLALVCFYQLIFTYQTRSVESKADDYANGDADKKFAYLDSMANETVFTFAWMRDYTYRECKEREINFGLDLKGGMNLILEVKVADVVRALSNYNTDPTFLQALKEAEIAEKNTSKDFITLFGSAFSRIDPNAQLSTIFNTVELKERITYNSTNEEVLEVIKEESKSAIDNAFNILRTRIDRFGVTQPNIQKLEKAGRVLVELPGVTDPQRVRKLLQGTASLEFWETYEHADLFQSFVEADKVVRVLESTQGLSVVESQVTDTLATSTEVALLDQVNQTNSASKDTVATEGKSFFSYLMPNHPQQRGRNNFV